MAKGVLVLLGSGETAPGMTKVHREVLDRLGDVRAVNLDTAYGFQENVPQMTEKLVDYFVTSLQTTLTPLHFSSYQHTSELERTILKKQIRDANYVFAGPGSPSFALQHWQPLGLAQDLETVINNGGTVCFASAAAVTLGAFTAPIYEIYKVGVTPYWLEGLDLMKSLGLSCVVIPHYDNAEGQNYDTSRCYIGERRLAVLEGQLPEGVATLGIDEHTALIVDVARATVRVLGRSNAHWRLNGTTKVLANGTTTDLHELQSFNPTGTPPADIAPAISFEQPVELGIAAAKGGQQGVEALSRLVQLATSGGEGFIDPAPLVNGILALRKSVREASQYQLADELRDVLMKAGVAVHDGPTASTWSLAHDA
jgi:peptidase E